MKGFLCMALLLFHVQPASAQQLRLLAINAANSEVDWPLVESFAKKSWSVQELKLDRFGPLMRNFSFQAALDDSEELLQKALTEKFDALIASSKGVNVVTSLIQRHLWDGPLVLLSPIPNACDHIRGGGWEEEWRSTMEVLMNVGPVAIGTGTSQDEALFVVDGIAETELCGKLIKGGSTHRFEKCPGWILRSFQGDHGWKSDWTNAPHIARLIDSLFHVALAPANAQAPSSEL
ncbi:Hypothetical protein SCF082_LOCUS47227 [Durusdinium trenchii]|uniref:Uncharacterized protein n=1 Tax=Durusdinium trenchii TaxID=1381693 RepID=A0ABP0RMW0_9DINO